MFTDRPKTLLTQDYNAIMMSQESVGKVSAEATSRHNILRQNLKGLRDLLNNMRFDEEHVDAAEEDLMRKADSMREEIDIESWMKELV